MFTVLSNRLRFHHLLVDRRERLESISPASGDNRKIVPFSTRKLVSPLFVQFLPELLERRRQIQNESPVRIRGRESFWLKPAEGGLKLVAALRSCKGVRQNMQQEPSFLDIFFLQGSSHVGQDFGIERLAAPFTHRPPAQIRHAELESALGEYPELSHPNATSPLRFHN